MIRKQIYLTEDLQRKIQVQSRMEKKPEALVIRELLERGLRQDKFGATIDSALKKLDDLTAQHGKVAPPDLSVHVDDYLYGNDN
jgi:hypothetical protein